MESFFYDDPWNPRRPRYADPSLNPKPRVVSIPVRVVGSDAAAVAPPRRRVVREEEAAVRIQRVFRGYLVRSSLGRVRRIAAEVDEAERRIAAEAAAIGGDAKERMRVGEMLMGLLLRLDSVRGVREYRRKVIRRVIALQEAVDSISAPDSVVETPNSETLEEVPMDSISAPDSVVETPNSETLEEVAMEETLEGSDLCGLEEESEAWDENDAPNSAPMPMEGALEEGGRRRGEEGMERLVEELCERSAEQCLIMVGLVERVETLERAMRRMEKQKKKKKKQLRHKKGCVLHAVNIAVNRLRYDNNKRK